MVAAVETPRLPELIQAIYKVPAPPTPRNDLTEIFLQGISKANAGLSGDPAVVLPVDLNSPGFNRDVVRDDPAVGDAAPEHVGPGQPEPEPLRRARR